MVEHMTTQTYTQIGSYPQTNVMRIRKAGAIKHQVDARDGASNKILALYISQDWMVDQKK